MEYDKDWLAQYQEWSGVSDHVAAQGNCREYALSQVSTSPYMTLDVARM